MSQQDEVLDTTLPFAARHAQRYAETDGAEGHMWNGVATLLLITNGRRSGKRRRTPLIYGRDGEADVVIASFGGAPKHPMWYLNLRDDPEVEVQVAADRFRARARTARGEERERLWATMSGIFPMYNQYQARTSRTIPVVVLERVS